MEAVIIQRAYVFLKFVGGDSRRGLNKRQKEIPRETDAESKDEGDLPSTATFGVIFLD